MRMNRSIRKALALLDKHGPLTPTTFARLMWPACAEWARATQSGVIGTATAYLNRLWRAHLVDRAADGYTLTTLGHERADTLSGRLSRITRRRDPTTEGHSFWVGAPWQNPREGKLIDLAVVLAASKAGVRPALNLIAPSAAADLPAEATEAEATKALFGVSPDELFAFLSDTLADEELP
jgi:hypothetical protein